MKASVEMSSSSASHVANKSLVAFDSLEAVEYHGFSAFFFFFTKNVPFRSALQGRAQGLFCSKDKIK